MHFQQFYHGGWKIVEGVCPTQNDTEVPITFRTSLDQSQPMDETGTLRPEQLGISKIVSLLVSLNEPNCKEISPRLVDKDGRSGVALLTLI